MVCIQVCGVQGVGKTTITSCLRRLIPLSVVKDYADFILEVKRDLNKDTIGYIPKHAMESIYLEADKKATQLGRGLYGKILIMESHLSIIREGEFVDVTNIPFFRNIQTVGIILVYAVAEKVSLRRLHDKNRRRTIDSVELIQRQQEINQIIANNIVQELEIPLLVINNSMERIADVSMEIKTWIESLVL